MSPNIKRIIKIGIGIISIPLIFASGRAFALQLKSFATAPNRISLSFFGGFASYLIFQLLFFKPMRTYVFGHELNHALWSMMFGGRVKRFMVRAEHGKVVLTKTNFLVNLAPYFFPLYSFFIVILYFILKCFGKEQKFFVFIIFSLGATFSFHLALLLYAFSLRQSDIKKTGRLFSLTLIILLNIIIAVFLLKFIMPDTIDISNFTHETLQVTWKIWVWLGHKSSELTKVLFQIIYTWLLKNAFLS